MPVKHRVLDRQSAVEFMLIVYNIITHNFSTLSLTDVRYTSIHTEFQKSFTSDRKSELQNNFAFKIIGDFQIW